LNRIAAPAAIVAALLVSGCGPKAITVGSKPFPSEKAVFTDASGRERVDLPEAEEPLRLVMLDFPWCPACGDAWASVQEARKTFPPGTVRLYRVLFDQEIAFTYEGRREVPPLESTPPPSPGAPGDSPDPDAVTLTALPGAFRGTYRVSQVPVLLLLERDGTVRRRWLGFSTALSGELSEEVRRRSPAPSSLPPGK
jgi:hypothetical protein